MEQFRFCMARKLRLEIGDYVYFKGYKAYGIVRDRYIWPQTDWKEWGYYGYDITWLYSPKGIPSNGGWCISDLITDNLTYLGKDAKVIEVLYGSKNIQKNK